MTIRPANAADIDALGALAEAAGLFPAAYLPDMIAPALDGGTEIWRVAEQDGAVAGFAFARPEEMADRVWNILAIAVAPSARGSGLAGTLLTATEAALDARLILIETTQLPAQAAARAFYAKHGYTEQGRIPDYYADGEDKVLFRKRVP